MFMISRQVSLDMIGYIAALLDYFIQKAYEYIFEPGGRLNIKAPSYQYKYKKCHYKDEMLSWP